MLSVSYVDRKNQYYLQLIFHLADTFLFSSEGQRKCLFLLWTPVTLLTSKQLQNTPQPYAKLNIDKKSEYTTKVHYLPQANNVVTQMR